MGKRVIHDLLTYPQASAECAGSGFIPTWDVANAYTLSGGVLRSNGEDISRTYNPFAEYELPTQLARISAGELPPEAFASKFGLLGYDRLYRPRIQTADQLEKHKKAYGDGDPLEWILAHSRTVALCLTLIDLLQNAYGEDEYGKAFDMQEIVEQAKAKPYARGLVYERLPANLTALALDAHPGGHAAIARGWLSRFISDNIAGISRRLERDAYGARLASFFCFRAMIETVYWQLANTIESGGVRRCLGCKRPFVARDKRQQYCPPFPGGSRSRCSSLVNVTNFRARNDRSER